MLHVCEYEVNRLTNETVIRENETLTQIFNDARRPAAHTDGISPIFKHKFLRKKQQSTILPIKPLIYYNQFTKSKKTQTVASQYVEHLLITAKFRQNKFKILCYQF